ncbi:MAG TPA: LuxR C-terminal-related transcriptional regulator [Streptosporangiaceae bacterium]|nr:LuxR C-terminal-related transcriptional regulator [Streptosporangiaceae bacterium]
MAGEVSVSAHASTHDRRPAVSAGDPILTSKITSPPVPDWAVPRPRITRLIAEGARWCPLTVVTGPPGAGKTLALALWAAAERGAVAWVGLDEFDNRPGVFWSYVVAALRQAGVAVPKTLRAVPPGEGQDGFLLRLTAALAAQDPPVTLVLDDLHLLTDPGVLKGLEFVLRNVGPGLRLLVASRMDPLLPLHRYRLAGQLTEIRASDLAFSLDEAGLLLDQHGGVLTADAVDSLTRRTEGWAAGLRLAAISLATHPDPDLFVKELAAEDSALTCYLVDEVLNVQPPQVREVLLATSILEHVSAEAAVELTGDDRAAAVLAGLARTNALVQPIGSGWYRYHTLFAEILRLRLRYEHPGLVVTLHRRAARWYERTGMLPDAVRHALAAGDWPLAAGLVVDDLAIGQIIEPRDGERLAGEFASLPCGEAWTTPPPYLVSAALALGAGQHEACAAALDAADGLLERLPAGQQAPARLAAAVLRLTLGLRTGDLAAAAAVGRAELMLGRVPAASLARHPDVARRVLAGRAAVELWSGRLDQAARVLEAGIAAEAAAGRECGQASLAGWLALAEALRGRLGRAADLAGQAAAAAGEHRPSGPGPVPLVALAWVHLARFELREARGCLRQADAALGSYPDKLTGTAAYLVAAHGALAEGRPAVAAQIIARARSGWSVPPWLDQQLTLAQSQAYAAAGDIQAALTTAGQAGTSPQAAITLARAQALAGDGQAAHDALAPALAADSETPDLVRLHAWLADARLGYDSGDDARGRRSLASALRLAEREQIRLPFALERDWLGPVLRRDPELTGAHRALLAPALGPDHLPAPMGTAAEPALIIEPLTDREREVLVHVSGMLNTAEVAEQMYISVNTVKTHLRNIYRKLAAAHRNEAVRRARQLELI